MKKHISILTAALLLNGAPSAFAASTTDLTVTGLITPVACTPTLSNNGDAYFGKWSAKDLNQTRTTPLGRKTLQLEVDCDGETPFALNLKENRPNTSIAPEMFGLGMINTNQKLGGFDISYSDAITEKGRKPILVSVDDGQSWNRSDNIPIDPGAWASVGDSSSGSFLPIPITNLTMTMEVRGYIARADSLTLTDDVFLDGNATLEVKYL